ncbi:hypothetical protein, partial [Xanthomonas translucens]|uniref:hypothetical protein n=1 Tax=Xanthomonas campestris pv. translucens TaxID=343 RepID=UPI00071BC656
RTVAAARGAVRLAATAAALAALADLDEVGAGLDADLLEDPAEDMLEREASDLGFMTGSNNDAHWESRNCTGDVCNSLAAWRKPGWAAKPHATSRDVASTPPSHGHHLLRESVADVATCCDRRALRSTALLSRLF